MTLEIRPLGGVPEIRAGDDLAGLLWEALGPDGLRDGDVLAVTQKVASKAEGRVVEGAKDDWVALESRRVLARRGDLVIAETRHGFVCANAGVDASNVAEGFVSLLPEDPDASAERLRAELQERSGVRVAVVVTDTFGRPWRRGVVNVAIGCAGLPSLVDLRGTRDADGRTLEATVVALADEIAAAAGLAMPKDGGIPAAVLRGIRWTQAASPASELVRPREEDLFRESPLLSISARRTIRSFGPGGIPREVLTEAAAAALTAPVPHGSRQPAWPWRWTVLDSPAAKRTLLSAMAEAWRRDLRSDGIPEATIERRLARSDALLGAAPALAVPALTMANADDYPDARRREAERDMFVLATGAAVQNFALALHAQGFGSAWVSSTLFCREETRAALGLDPEWIPMGALACGPMPAQGPPPRPPVDPGSALRFA